MTVIEEIAAERQRQIEAEGFTAEHDDEHDAGELAGAGSAYALNAASELHPFSQLPIDAPPDSWLWDRAAWKPKEPRRDLIRAAALLVAEIERIDREEAKARHQ